MRIALRTRSLRLRLAVVFTLLVAAIITLVGLVTYHLLRQSLLDGVERDIIHHATTFQVASPAPPYDLDVVGGDVLLQVVAADGSVLGRSGNLGHRDLPLPERARAGEVVKVRIDGRPVLVVAAPLDDGGYVVAGKSPAATYGALRTLRHLLIAVLATAAALTGAMSWLYARAALRPVARVVGAATTVRDSRDLGRRVAPRGPPDELGRLVEAFNDMLAELEAAHAKLDQANQRMRRFLTDCAHELRTPLARIRSTVDVLERLERLRGAGGGTAVSLGAGDFRTQALTDIAAETDRMSRMIRPLLILARADAGVSIEPRPVWLAQVLVSVCRQAARMAHNATLVTPPPGALGEAVVTGDADHLEQLLLILLDNAFKYMRQSGQVRVNAYCRDGAATVSVTDAGPGIPPQDADRIFERFYRGRNGATAPGTGVGLAIARWIAEQHQGRIEYTPVDHGGSTFSVILPLAGEPEPRPTHEQPVGSAPTIENRSMTVRSGAGGQGEGLGWTGPGNTGSTTKREPIG